MFIYVLLCYWYEVDKFYKTWLKIAKILNIF